METNKVQVAICVPTSRRESITKFIAEWSPFWNNSESHEICLFIHEDRQSKECNSALETPIGLNLKLTCQNDIEKALGDREWIIPKGTSACRSFPIYLAWRAGFEYIITMDDDCYPCPESLLIDGHLRAFKLDRWFNTIDGEFARGIPYENKGSLPVRVNHGLWTESPDLDGPTSLVRKRKPSIVTLEMKHRVVPPGMAVPLCGMNICYHRSVVPAAYYMLMGLQTFGFDRFDDIWSGILLKKILDHHGWYVTTGAPFVRHSKASNCFVNIRKEALGLHLNEYFWEYIMESKLSLNCGIIENYKELAIRVGKFSELTPEMPSPKGYFEKLGDSMIQWAELFVP